MLVAVGGLTLVSVLGAVPLQVLAPGSSASPSGSTNALTILAWLLFGLSFTAVGFVVARRKPRNPMGWLLLGASAAFQLGSDAPGYAYLDYHSHHGALPLGPVAVLLSGGWVYGFLLVPLIILLFPDGRPGPRWRWPLAAYLTVLAVLIAATQGLAVTDLRLRAPVDGSGNLIGLNHPGGWFGPFFYVGFLSCFVLCIAAVISQVLRYRRASGERRQQFKWLGAAAAISVVFLLATTLWTDAPGFVGSLLFPLALTALPVGIGVGILRYRLYEIDRLISRTLSYVILTALLVGTFIGLIALTTNTLALSGRVGVAASTLAAAALFNPLRVRIQRLVDHRFNRARYDADAIVATFSARLRDAVELDAIRSELLNAVDNAVQPISASVWLR